MPSDNSTRLNQLTQEIATMQAQVATTAPAQLPALLAQLQVKLDEQTRLQEQAEFAGNQFSAQASDSGTVIQAGGNVTNASGGGIAIGGNVGGSVNQVQGDQTIDQRQVNVGSGAYAEGDNSTAVGAGGFNMSGGSIDGPVITGTGNTINIGSKAGLEIDPTKVNDPYNLRKKMIKHLSEQEILGVIHDLEINTGMLPGNSLQEKVIAVIDYCQKRGLTEDLLRFCEQENGYVDWRV